MGLRGESRINRRPPRSSFHPPQYTVVANSGGGVKDDSAPPSGGVGSSRWKELIEVASPISGRELDPTLPPLVPRPTLPSNHTLPSDGGPCWTPPTAPGRRLGLLPPGRVVHLWSSRQGRGNLYVRLGARRVSSMRSLPWAPPVIKASIPRNFELKYHCCPVHT